MVLYKNKFKWGLFELDIRKANNQKLKNSQFTFPLYFSIPLIKLTKP